MKLCITHLGEHQTVIFAAQELARYLERIAGVPCEVGAAARYGGATRSKFWVGVAEAFPGLASPPVRESSLDDAVAIDTEGDHGIIAGVNPRSVLIAVYRYLHELGCRWVRPGPDGEYLPPVDLARSRVRVGEAASYRHRGVDFGGAISQEHLIDFIDWMPKLGFNGYFLELDNCFSQCGLWYGHASHPAKKPEPFTPEAADAIRRRMVEEVRKRDGLYHAKGHGWTMDCVGVPHHGWDDVAKGPPSADVAPFLAEVKGRRAFFRDKPLFTNLCYANPEVERKFIGCVADYAQSHPEIDFMHVWLADAANNFCECAECRKTRPSDRYVILLNGLDAELTRRALKTRIVFLAYLDMLWPPETERLAHPERFVFMFAPISRAYDASYAQAQDASRSAVIPPFRYNEVALPPTVAENMAFLWAWQPHAPCDSFCFDYHYYFGLPNDLAGMTLARVLHEDIRHLAPMGLNGLVSCQTLRSVLPSGFGMTVMGETLWNRECDLGALLADHFRAAFGEDGDACAAWLNKASEAIGLAKIHVAPPVVACAVAAALSAVAEEIGRFMPVIERNRTAPDRCRAASWRAMADHNAILCALMRTLEARARGDAESKKKHLDETVRLVWECEDRQSALLDGWLTRLMLRTKLLP